MIHLDTSILVNALTGPKRSAAALRTAIERGERITFSAIVLYEWLRGPRRQAELAVQEALFPRESVVALGPGEAALAAELYRGLRRPRGREIDLAVAACALTQGAMLWTLDRGDFVDIPGLSMYAPA